jgi:hypothetical protein
MYIMPAVCSILNDIVVAAYRSAFSTDFLDKNRLEILILFEATLLSLHNVALSQNIGTLCTGEKNLMQ